MLSKPLTKALNDQIAREAYAESYYMAMASWLEISGFPGGAKFMFGHAAQEREHMMKLFHYVSSAGGHALVPERKAPPESYQSLTSVIEKTYEHEVGITKHINELVEACLQEKDYSTFNFLQWYVAEQHEEERLFMQILDRAKIIGTDGRGEYWIDKELASIKSPQE